MRKVYRESFEPIQFVMGPADLSSFVLEFGTCDDYLKGIELLVIISRLSRLGSTDGEA